jgi:hypothetical protein
MHPTLRTYIGRLMPDNGGKLSSVLKLIRKAFAMHHRPR